MIKELREKAGENGILGIISPIAPPSILETVALAGVDFYMLDGEHGVLQADVCERAVVTARSMGLKLGVRVPHSQTYMIGQMLDMGFDAVMVPQVSTVEFAKTCLDEAFFPPVGVRGAGPCRANHYALDIKTSDYVADSNRRTSIELLIEDIDGVNALPEMLKLPGVDGVFVGTRDLSTSLGCPGDMDNPLMQKALDRIVDTCQASDVVLTLPIACQARYSPKGVNSYLAHLNALLYNACKAKKQG